MLYIQMFTVNFRFSLTIPGSASSWRGLMWWLVALHCFSFPPSPFVVGRARSPPPRPVWSRVFWRARFPAEWMGGRCGEGLRTGGTAFRSGAFTATGPADHIIQSIGTIPARKHAHHRPPPIDQLIFDVSLTLLFVSPHCLCKVCYLRFGEFMTFCVQFVVVCYCCYYSFLPIIICASFIITVIIVNLLFFSS